MIFPLAQYINYNSTKIPTDALTGEPVDPHNPHNHLTHQEATDRAALYGLGVGFVFTATDPYFFLDIDHTLLPDNTWDELALTLCALFSGCYIEISMSGTGLHIFGTYTTTPAHSCKNIANGIELYTSERYVALTGTGAQGDTATPADAPLQQLIQQYFTPDPTMVAAEWTETPDPDSNPLTSDDKLIEKMLASRGSASTVFGSGATVAQLWNCDIPALSIAYTHESEPFDRSSADAALCQHLAFWTGKDCGRIERLMGMSALVRDKWTKREDYRRRTILNQVARCNDTYGTPEMSVEEITKQFAFNKSDNKIYELSKPGSPGMVIAAFKRAYGIYDDNWLSKPEPVIIGTGYHPSKEAVYHDLTTNGDVLNTFRFPAPTAGGGTVERFLDLTHKLWDVHTPYVLDLLASIIQEPHRRIQVMPILVSGFGAGKDTWIDYFKACIGYWNCSQESLANIAGVGQSEWGNWAANSLICVCSEAETSGKEKYSLGAAIRDKITNGRLPLNMKSGTTGSVEVFTAIFAFTNLNSAVMIPRGDRRIFIHRTDHFIDEPLQRAQYFSQCRVEINDDSVATALYRYLSTRPITNDPYGHAPVTPYKQLLMSGDNDTEIIINSLIDNHPCDLIFSPHLRDIIKIETGKNEIDERQYNYSVKGLLTTVNGGKKIRVNGSVPKRVFSLRNHGKWVGSTSLELQQEIGE